MSIRQTRREYTGRIGRGPRLTAIEFMARVKRLMARRMVSDGVVEQKPVTPRFTWYYEADARFGHVSANTRGEARAAVKQQLGVKRLPANLFLTKDVPHEDSTTSAGAA